MDKHLVDCNMMQDNRVLQQQMTGKPRATDFSSLANMKMQLKHIHGNGSFKKLGHCSILHCFAQCF